MGIPIGQTIGIITVRQSVSIIINAITALRCDPRVHLTGVTTTCTSWVIGIINGAVTIVINAIGAGGWLIVGVLGVG